MIRNILVLGSGSAGLLAGLAFQRKLPGTSVRIVRSPEIGTIGVGEGTTPLLPEFLFDYLGISRKRFYAHAEPIWKIGVRFLWGHAGTMITGLTASWTSNGTTCPDPTGSTARMISPARMPSAHEWSSVKCLIGSPVGVGQTSIISTDSTLKTPNSLAHWKR